MKKILLLTTTLLISTAAFADSPAPAMNKRSTSKFSEYYAKIELGGTKLQKVKISGSTDSEKFKVGFVGGIGGGYRFNEFFSTDLMLQYRHAKAKSSGSITSGKFRNYSAVLNAYLDAHNDTIFTPYLMAGIGVGHNKAEATITGNKAKASKTTFIWNVGLGVNANVYEQIDLGLGYRYVNLGRSGSKTVANANYKFKEAKAHEILASLTYNL